MSSNTKGEGEIRQALVGQLFYNTQIPVCLGFGGKSNTLDFANYARLLDGETELGLVA